MKRSLHVVALAVLAVLLVGPLPNSLARPPGPRIPADRAVALPKAVDVGPDAAAAYATGTVVHADALRAAEHALVDLDVAFSGAAFTSAGAPGDSTNEVNRLVAHKLDINGAFGRGTGLELGLGSDPVPLIGQLSQASAPPSTNLIHKVVGPIGVPGVVRAELLRSQAQSRSATDACVLGPDQAYGLGSVLNLELLGGLLSTVARPAVREVSQSTSTTRIVPSSEPGRLGLKSETRQTIAPVTFLYGTPFQFTVEVLGEWALRATADGLKGSVHYGPLALSPETPVVRILDAKGKVEDQLTTQMLLGQKGLEVTIPGVAEIVVGEDPRVIGGDASSAPVVEPTAVVAAADVVRVKLLSDQAADVRIGHMEAAVTVPVGGVRCPGVKVDQTVDTPAVAPGDQFTYTIDVTNPNDCVLQNVKLVETPNVPAGVKIELLSMTPAGGDLSGGVATYPDLSPLEPGQTKTVTVTVRVLPDSAPGTLVALATVTGICPADLLPSTDVEGPATTGSPATGDIPVSGADTVTGPAIRLVNVTVGGPLCTVPSLIGLTPEQAKPKLAEAGCDLGTVTAVPTDNPADFGKITTQKPLAGDKVPTGTKVDVVIAGPPVLATSRAAGSSTSLTRAATEPATAAPPAAAAAEQASGAGTDLAGAPAIARTGGVVLAGLALWLLLGGITTRLAGSKRLWALARRRIG